MKARPLTGPSVVRPATSHKTSAPTAHRHAVEREQLLARMFGEAARQVVVIHGPAGHGKTSLLLQARTICRRKRMLTGWLSLDEADNDANRFFGDVQEMVAALGVDIHADVSATNAAAEPAGGASRADWLLGRLVELERPVALFIDDLHFINDRVVLSYLRELLASSPESIRWFIASRVVPDIGLPRLLVGERATLIRPEELRFSAAEVHRFFEEAREVEVSADERRAIHEATEGWPAAVQLYRLALDSPQVRASLRSGRDHHVREMTDYLADNVLMRQERRIQDFLLRTSILDRMTAPLCDSLLQTDESQEILTLLERTGLFVRRIDSDQQWFTYHAVFSRFLRAHLQAAAPDHVEHLHRRAARWHREEGHFEEALHHFSLAGDHAPAADVFEMWAERLVPDGHMATVDRWSDAIPMEELERRPGLVVKIVWALAFLSRHRKIGPFLELLREARYDADAVGDPRVAMSMVAILGDDLAKCHALVEGIDTDVVSSSRFRNFELSAVANARGYHLMVTGRHDEALKHLERGRVLSEFAGATFTWAYSIGKSALTLMSQGQLQEALVLYRKALSGPRMYGEESQSTACLACGFVATLYEMQEFDQALEQFRQYRELIASAGIHDYLVIAYRAVARIHDCRGQPREALEILEEAEQLALSGQWPRVLRLVAWERVRRELLAGHLDRARIVAGRIRDSREPADGTQVRLSEDAEDGILGRIRLHIHAGEIREAQRLLQAALRQAVASGRVHRQVKLHALGAIARRKAGNDFQAQQSLEQALALAAPGQYTRALLDEGEEMTQLMLEYFGTRSCLGARAGERGVDRFLARLLESIGPEPSEQSGASLASGTTPVRLEEFTEREQQILSQIVNYMSNDQIAANLVVTRDTVKFHIKNIYAKLGVKNRLEAIRAVRQGRG
ncbi:MAG: tetratricopeptide repeat protein [Gammaproteobacteria bacterium]|nr:tetratricopeptide repeat protein [Gammaproteobacteria bacterium]